MNLYAFPSYSIFCYRGFSHEPEMSREKDTFLLLYQNFKSLSLSPSTKNKNVFRLGAVTQAYNPTYSGVGD
jgi:hypothetical protein